MEILFEVAFVLLQFVCELLVQMVFEVFAEVGLRSIREPFRRPEPENPFLAAIGYPLLGAGAGGLSLLLFPALIIESRPGRILNLILTPLAAGAIMSAIGAWRRRKDQDLIRLDRFAYGFLFAFSMAVVRFHWGNHG